MKSILLTFVLTCAFSGYAFAECSNDDKSALEAFDRAWGDAGEKGARAALTAIYADDYTGLPGMQYKTATGSEQAVRQTLNDLAAALGKNDAAALDRIYDNGYTFVSDTGVLTTKASRLAAFRSGELKFESVNFDDVKIYIYGDTAVATFIVTSKYAPGVKSLGGKFMTTATFINRKGRWTEIAAQSTRIGE